MLSCINKNSVEFQTLKNRSGLSEFVIESVSRNYIDKLGRFPELDELPGSNSEPNLRESLKIKKDDSTSINNILDYTGASTVQEANITINNQFRDLEVNILPLNKDAIVDIQHRPSIYDIKQVEKVSNIQEVNSSGFFNTILDKLASLYGINFIKINNIELESERWKNIIVDAKTAQAFIYNNNIYINTDIASIDSPIHELMHLFIGSIKFTNPELYYNLVNLSEQFTGYDQLVKKFKNRTRSDINEELLVTEVSRYLVGKDSILGHLDDSTKYEISYNIHRLIDSILMGTDSSNILGQTVYDLSLKSLAKKLNSTVMNNNFQGKLSDAEIHRIMQNEKAELMESGKLKEYC